MSWSVRITILYLGFVGIILTLVFTCFGHKTELEYKDYYAKELKFQDQIDATNNATLLDTPIEHMVEGRNIRIAIPESLLSEDLSASAVFMRPSDSSLDKTIELEPSGHGLCLIENAGFSKGVYKMKLIISSRGKNYFKEAVINFK